MIRDVLDGTFQEATRVMSPSGLEDLLHGAVALSNLGRRPDLAITYIEETPLVAKECSEDIIPDRVTAAWQRCMKDVCPKATPKQSTIF